ncbi:hypothetical protein WME94_35115 [Sorangium sp. So ce429]
MKLDGAGNHLWSRGSIIGAAIGNESVRNIAVDALGNAYRLVHSSSSTSDGGALLRMDAAGEILWQRSIPVLGYLDYDGDVALDSAGSALVVSESADSQGMARRRRS